LNAATSLFSAVSAVVVSTLSLTFKAARRLPIPLLKPVAMCTPRTSCCEKEKKKKDVVAL
jgi:hypothetical protein